jgi:disulfide bond formation protein DsbB
MSKLQKTLLYLIFLQALVATLGSLYYSTYGDPVTNVLRGDLFNTLNALQPCLLCWYARILMYPLVIISLVAMIRKDKNVPYYILSLSVPGIFLEIYHYALQKLPIKNLFGCTLENPCNALQVNYLGFITIPFLALVAFLVITFVSILFLKFNKPASK